MRNCIDDLLDDERREAVKIARAVIESNGGCRASAFDPWATDLVLATALIKEAERSDRLLAIIKRARKFFLMMAGDPAGRMAAHLEAALEAENQGPQKGPESTKPA